MKHNQSSTIFTLGYEGSSVEDFIATLKLANIDTVVDIREFPISRKKGFSKTAFSLHLNSSDIKYIHLVDLGCPKSIRDQYRIDHDWKKYTASFIEYLKTQERNIVQLGQLSSHASICLVCFERDQNFCHRSLVAGAIKQTNNIQIKHLGVKKGLADEPALLLHSA